MEKIIRSLILVAVIACFFSCVSQRPISKLPPSNNGTYEVEYLFEHDGCKVYRFKDYGHNVYFTNCSNSITSVENDSTQIHVQNMMMNKDSR
jgi:hypothetical protein